MKELLGNLVQLLKSASGPTRVVLGAGVATLVLVTGFSAYRARNPHMSFLVGGLSNAEFSAVTSALGTAGIRFDTSSGHAPYSVFVEASKKYDARNAIALEGAMASGPRGITAAMGSSSVFKSSGERAQEMNARFWQEVEMQLERLSWVAAATVTASTPVRSPLGRARPPQVAVLLETRGLIEPSPQQRQTAATLVQRAFGVPAENIVVTDQNGTTLFDGSQDPRLADVLEFEQNFTATETRRAQEKLDQAFGPGMAVVSVKGEWLHDRMESVGERLDPKKLLLSESTTDTSTPASTPPPGGPAGVQANITLNDPTTASRASDDPATTNETRRDYDYARTTTHTLQDKPTLQRLSVTLLVDASMEDQKTVAADFVKNLVGYREGRDEFQVGAVPLATVERDEEGNPLAPVPVVVEAPNAMLTLLLERGVEIVAALAFIVLLARSLKRTKPKPAPATETRVAADVDEAEEEIDLELLAQRRVDEILENDPEKVGALLSRWALGESYYEEEEEAVAK
ncbi:MAG: hypothetical protein GY711_04505 [bacterium]|nr:hypothetical protein [bacterium]